MLTINVKQARQNFSAILERVSSGEEVVITKHGREIAHIVPHSKKLKANKLPSLKNFRKAITIKGEPMSTEVVSDRDKERF